MQKQRKTVVRKYGKRSADSLSYVARDIRYLESSMAEGCAPMPADIRALADQIYRTRENRRYCRVRGIRLSGPKIGRPGKTIKEDRKQEY